MLRPDVDWFESVAARAHPGHMLPPELYVDERAFRLERERLLSSSWVLVAHASRIASPGDCAVGVVAGAPIVLTRALDGSLRGFHNTCRHRGARVCEADGNRSLLVCPYHQWSYALDGTLVRARGMSASFDSGAHALAPIAVREVAGLVFARLDGVDDGTPALIAEHVGATLRWHGLERMRTAHEERWRVRANWKLCVENFDECYHCWPGHPEYSAVMAHARAECTGDPSDVAAFDERMSALSARERAAGRQLIHHPPAIDKAFWCVRLPMHEGKTSQSLDGRPRAPVVQPDALGSVTSLRIDPCSHVIVNPDYAMLVRFDPSAADETHVILTWLVSSEARPGVDYDVDELTKLWRVTTEQDNAMLENQHAGLMSPAARSGPYSDAEEFSAMFVAKYLARMGARS